MSTADRIEVWDEWLVQGVPDQQDGSTYTYTWSPKDPLRFEHEGTAEAGARAFIATVKQGPHPWDVGPNLFRRTVTQTPWIEVTT